MGNHGFPIFVLHVFSFFAYTDSNSNGKLDLDIQEPTGWFNGQGE